MAKFSNNAFVLTYYFRFTILTKNSVLFHRDDEDSLNKRINGKKEGDKLGVFKLYIRIKGLSLKLS